MSDQPNSILLVTASEYAEIQKFVGMGLDLETLGRAIGEIVSVPAPELALPIFFQIDARAPQLRFVDYPEVKAGPNPPPPPPQAGPSQGPTPVTMPDGPDLGPLINSAQAVYLVVEL